MAAGVESAGAVREMPKEAPGTNSGASLGKGLDAGDVKPLAAACGTSELSETLFVGLGPTARNRSQILLRKPSVRVQVVP